MATIRLTDNAGLTAALQIRDDSPLAKAGLTQLASTVSRFAGNITRPIGQTDLRTVVLGATLTAPSALIGGAASLAVKGVANGALSVFTAADETLFGDDPFAPAIPIAADDVWVEFEIDASLDAKLAGTVDGFGVGVEGAVSLSLATYTLVKASASLTDGIQAALDHYGVACTAAAVRSQPAGTVRAADLAGTLTFSGSYAIPISVNALASADLPFNYRIELNPAITAEVAGQIALTGDFLVRAHKVGDTEVRLGVYKKKGTTLSASLYAGVGVEANLGKTDLIGAIFGAVMPKVDPQKAGITGDTAAAFKTVVNDAINRSLSIAVNVECAASKMHEAAVIYSIDLAAGDPAATDAAIRSALSGDWTSLDRLPNARALRNIVRDTKDYTHKLAISLLGLYNAASIETFVQSCTVLRDGDGQIVITDRSRAGRIAAASTPLVADTDKLRSALAEDFLVTAAYTAAAGAKLKADLSVTQTYFRYENQMSRQEMKDAVLLARALGRNLSLDASSSFRHARIAAAVRYDNAAAMRLFFSDSEGRVPHTREDLVRIGRAAMRALIDPDDPAGGVRLRVLADDAAWHAMEEIGNTAQFGFIPALTGLSFTELNAVDTDWIDIAWWADSMVQVAPVLAAMLDAVAASQAADPTVDPVFMEKRKRLGGVLGAVTRQTHAAFVGGWGLAVMFAVSGGTAPASVDIAVGRAILPASGSLQDIKERRNKPWLKNELRAVAGMT